MRKVTVISLLIVFMIVWSVGFFSRPRNGSNEALHRAVIVSEIRTMNYDTEPTGDGRFDFGYQSAIRDVERLIDTKMEGL